MMIGLPGVDQLVAEEEWVEYRCRQGHGLHLGIDPLLGTLDWGPGTLAVYHLSHRSVAGVCLLDMHSFLLCVFSIFNIAR
jgi:hypothetical protein